MGIDKGGNEVRKLSNLVIFLVLVCLVIGACSNTEGSNNEAANSNEEPSENFNETGMPIVDEEITLNIFARRAPPNGRYEDMLVFQEYEDMTNVKINWDDVPQDGFAERKNLQFATSELPDVFYRADISRLEAVRYGTSGILLPLEGLIEEYAPNLQSLFEEYPEVEASLTAPDGHIYTIPSIMELDASRTEKFWLNKTWLDHLGLRVPTNPDELVEVLTAFRDDDPNGNGQQDEIPMTFRHLGQLLDSMSGSWGS